VRHLPDYCGNVQFDVEETQWLCYGPGIIGHARFASRCVNWTNGHLGNVITTGRKTIAVLKGENP